MKKVVALASLALIATACAKRPDAILPVEIPMAAYTNDSCAIISQELVKEQNNLAALSKQQNSAATGDAVGVFLIGAPLSSMTGGDKEGQIAVSKGKINAIEAAMRNKKCNSTHSAK